MGCHVRRKSMLINSYLFALFCILCPVSAVSDTITIFAASSIGTVIKDIAKEFEIATQNTVTVVTAGSSTLARQIENGAPADLFLSANVAWADYIEKQVPAAIVARKDIAENSLVLVTSDIDILPFDDIAKLTENMNFPDTIAMAMLSSVPAGIYGKASLTFLGMWPTVEPYVVQADNVRTAMQFVALGEAKFGVVYATDALLDDRVRVVYRFPNESHDRIVYPLIQLTKNRVSQEFYNFVTSRTALEIFEKYGFIVPMAKN